jgi:hypothetical protein
MGPLELPRIAERDARVLRRDLPILSAQLGFELRDPIVG